MMSERESTKCAQHGEGLRWSSDSEAEVELLGQVKQSGQRDKAESEDETEFGVVWECFVVNETEGDAISEARTEQDELDPNEARWTVEARVAPAASLPVNEDIVSLHGSSPCLSEFEEILTKVQANKGEAKDKLN